MHAYTFGDRVRVVASTTPAHSLAIGSEGTVIDGSASGEPLLQRGAMIVAAAPDPYAMIEDGNGLVQVVAATDVEVLA